MFQKFTTADKLLMVAAFLSLVFSETLWFQGEHEAGIFIGIWVPSILCFGIYLKCINNYKNDQFTTLLCWIYNFIIWNGFLLWAQRVQEIQIISKIKLRSQIDESQHPAGVGCHSKTHNFQSKNGDARKWISDDAPSVYSLFDLSKTQTIPFGKLYQ